MKVATPKKSLEMCRAFEHFITIALACALIGCASTPQKAAHPVEPRAHSFAIYLVVALPPDKPSDAVKIPSLATLPVYNEPLLTDADIISYDFTKHEMLLKQAETVLSPLAEDAAFGTPFVVVADGQRIYTGVIGSLFSSQSVSVPTILIWTPKYANPLTIDWAYPGPEFAAGPDPRSDERIRVALAALKKLK